MTGVPAMTSIRRCVCPGSYDPVTEGHVDVIRRATALFDEVVVAVLHNPAKAGRFDLDTRLKLLRASLEGVDRVRVMDGGTGLLVDFCRDVAAVAILKGLRGETDFAYELPMALMNRHLTGVETVFISGDPRYAHVSSSLIKEVAGNGGDVRGLVPDVVLQALLGQG